MEGFLKMFYKKSRGNLKGTTLIEAVVALLILSVGFVGVAMLQGQLAASNTLAKQRSEAATIAQDLIEEYRSFGELTTTAGYTAYSDIASGNDTVSGVNASYTRTWAVVENVNPNYKTVTVTVSWTGATRDAQSLSLSTIIAGSDPVDVANYEYTTTTISP